MNRQDFSLNPQVRDFVAWAGTFHCDADGHLVPSCGGALSTLAVALDIPKSAKVPIAVRRRSPIGELTRWYSWRANGMVTGDFAETRATVAELTQAIRGARTRESAVAAIERILWWGGNRVQGQPLPAVLSFPKVGAGGKRRGVRSRFPGCIAPPALYYGGKSQPTEVVLRSARVWAAAKVRLGWLLAELLEKPTPEGMRSLEACLFMAGYDCSSINR